MKNVIRNIHELFIELPIIDVLVLEIVNELRLGVRKITAIK